MTRLLQRAFEKAAELAPAEQDRLARFLLAELESERRWDELLSQPESEDLLERLAEEALADHRARRTQPLAPQDLRQEASAMNSRVSVPKAALASFCESNGIRRLAIFGSALRDDFGPESDIDLLVEFEPDRNPGLLGIAGMELELSELFSGRKIDLRTLADLSPYFRQDVLDRAAVQYARE